MEAWTNTVTKLINGKTELFDFSSRLVLSPYHFPYFTESKFAWYSWALGEEMGSQK